MNIEEIIKERPHLKETLNLYKRIFHLKEINVSGLGSLPQDEPMYHRDDIERIITVLSELLEIPEEALMPIKELMLSGRIDIRRLPLGDVMSFDLPYQEEELISLMYLLSKPFFLAERRKLDLQDMFWTEGKCPVCNSIPSVSFIGKEEKRRFYCSYCETVGTWKRIGCPSCLNEDAETITILYLEGEEGMRVDACERCKNYFKSFDSSMLMHYTADLLDLISLPLDIIIQGKGFQRASPNPLGMIRMA